MEEKKNQMFASLMALKASVEDAKKKVEDFYSPMRWENLGLSTKEYETLYDSGKIYELEETDIFNLLEELESSLTQILK